MKFLIVGYGSIGQRHAKILDEKQQKIFVCTQKLLPLYPSFSNLKMALKNVNPDALVISNRTADHEDSIQLALDQKFKGHIFVEKPISNKAFKLQQKKAKKIYVLYNLRFHPLITEISRLLKKERVLSVLCYVGQYLPNWRPGLDYTKQYSASKKEGGGVLLDLSHEIDYLQNIFGSFTHVCSIGGKISNLKITSDDSFSVIAKTKNVPQVLLQMNYLDHISQRFIIINTNDKTYKVDFNTSTITVNRDVQVFQADRNSSYNIMWDAYLNSDFESFTTFSEATTTLRVIDKIEKSNRLKKWIKI